MALHRGTVKELHKKDNLTFKEFARIDGDFMS